MFCYVFLTDFLKNLTVLVHWVSTAILGLSLAVVSRLLIVAASLAAEHGL